MRLNLPRVLPVQIDAASRSPHTLLFQDQEIGGYLMLSLPGFHIFFLILAITQLIVKFAVMKRWVMKSYCCGPQVLTLLSDTEFPFSIMLLLLNVADFSWPGLQDPLWPQAEGELLLQHPWSLYKDEVFILVIFHSLSINDLSSNYFLTCKVCSKYFRSTGILLVIFFCFFFHTLFCPQRSEVAQLTMYFFSLSPFPPVLSSSGLFLSTFFFFWCFCPALVLIM